MIHIASLAAIVVATLYGLAQQVDKLADAIQQVTA